MTYHRRPQNLAAIAVARMENAKLPGILFEAGNSPRTLRKIDMDQADPGASHIA